MELIYLPLPSLELSILRVAERVTHGGHNVPLPVLRRRFPRSLQLLLHTYAQECSILDPLLYDQLPELAR